MDDTSNNTIDDDNESPLKFIRLSTGEDVLTEVLTVQENSKEHYVLINPLKIVYMVGERPGSLMLSLIEWIFPKICSTQEFILQPKDIITSSDPSDQMADYYYEALYKLDKTKDAVKLDEDHTNISSEDEREEASPHLSEEDELDYIKQAIDILTKNKRTLH